MARALTPRQVRFCQEYANGCSGAEAYRRAGYNVKNGDVAASCAEKLLRKADVQKKIQYLQDSITSQKIMRGQEMQEALSEIARDTTGRVDLRMKAMDLLAKMQGLMVNRSEINGDLTIDVVLERAEDGGDDAESDV